MGIFDLVQNKQATRGIFDTKVESDPDVEKAVAHVLSKAEQLSASLNPNGQPSSLENYDPTNIIPASKSNGALVPGTSFSNIFGKKLTPGTGADIANQFTNANELAPEDINIKVPFTGQKYLTFESPFNDREVFGNTPNNLLNKAANFVLNLPGAVAQAIPRMIITASKETQSFGTSKEYKLSPFQQSLYGDTTYHNVNNDINSRIENGDGILSSYLGAISEKALDVLFGADVLSRGLVSVSKTLAQDDATARIEAWKTLGSPKNAEEAKINYQKRAQQLHPDKIGGSGEGMKVLNMAKSKFKSDFSDIPTFLDTVKSKAASYLEWIGRQSKLSDPLLKPDIKVKDINGKDIGALRLPGYKETPGQAPAMGLSIRKVERVGGTEGENEAKKFIKDVVDNVKATVPAETPVVKETLSTSEKPNNSIIEEPKVCRTCFQQAEYRAKQDPELSKERGIYMPEATTHEEAVKLAKGYYNSPIAERIKTTHFGKNTHAWNLDKNGDILDFTRSKESGIIDDPEKYVSEKELSTGEEKTTQQILAEAEAKAAHLGKATDGDIKKYASTHDLYEVNHVETFKSVEDARQFVEDQKDTIFRSKALNDEFRVNDVTTEHLFDKERTPEEYVRRAKLFASGLKIAQEAPDVMTVDKITDKDKGIIYYNLVGKDQANFPNKVIKVTLSEKDGKVMFSVSTIRKAEIQTPGKTPSSKTGTSIAQGPQRGEFSDVQKPESRLNKSILPSNQQSQVPEKGPINIAQAKVVALSSANIDDFEAVLKGGEGAMQPFYEEGKPIAITNTYYDQVVSEMKAEGYTSLSDFYEKQIQEPVPAAPIVEKTVVAQKAPTIGVTAKEVPIDPVDIEKLDQYTEMKSILQEQLDSHPGKKLQRYISKKEGQFLDTKTIHAKTPAEFQRLNQVNIDRAKKLMAIMDQAGIDTSGLSADNPDEFRDFIDQYKAIQSDYEDIVAQEKLFKAELKERQAMMKDEKALEKLADRNQAFLEKQVLTETEKQRKATLAKTLEDRQDKLLEIQERVRAQQNRITEAQKTQLPPPLNFLQKINALFRPLKYLDDKTREIFKKWKSDIILSHLDGKAESKKLAFIPEKQGFDTILDYQRGKSQYQTQIKKVFDDLYTLAEKEMGYNLPSELALPDSMGFLDKNEANVKELGYLKNYLPQIWADSTDQLKNAVQRFLESKGLAPEQIAEYLTGKALNTETASRLKLNPRFQKERVFPSYEVGMEHGLTPKFTHPGQLAGWYMEELRRSQANRTFLDDMLDQAKIMPPDAAPSGWKNIEAPFMKGEVYKAPPRLARVFNGLFRDEEHLGVGESFLKGAAKVSGTAQDIILTSGVPYTQINSFSLGTAVLDLTRGDLRSAKAIIRSNSDPASRKFFEAHNEDLYRMARQGIDVGETVDDFTHAWKVNRADPQFYNKFIHTVGDIGNAAFTEKIFNSYIPQVMIEIYSGAYKELIKNGVSPLLAEKQAADILRTTRAISENEAFRSKGLQDFLKAFFFAPRYREAMIKVYGNILKSVTTKARDPRYRNMRKLFLGAVITYVIYNYINYQNNGEFMWQNEPGHEFDLKFQRADGTYVYTPFLGATSAVVRNIGSGIVGLVQGDTKTAGQKFGSLFSVPLKTTAEILSNRDYFGNEIYGELDTGSQKAEKIAAYIGVAVNHPYIAHLIKYFAGKEPAYQALSYALELPIKYSSREKESTKEFYNEQDKQAKEYAQLKQKVLPVFEHIKDTGIAGTPEGDTYLKENLLQFPNPKEAYTVYASLKKADKAAQTRSRTAQMYYIVKQASKIGFGTADADTYIKEQLKNGDDYKIYQSVKKKFIEGDTGKPYGFVGQMDDRPLVNKILTYADAIGTDPLTAFNRIVTGQHIKDVNGNAIVVNRIAFKDPEGIDSSEIKAQLGAFSNQNGGEQQILEHRIPLVLGGDNSRDNLYLVPKSIHDEWTPIEVYLGQQVREGKMSKKQSQEIILKVRGGMTFEEVKAIKPDTNFLR